MPGADNPYAGLVTNEEPPRFVPDLAPDKRLRLTTISIVAASGSSDRELDLRPYKGRRIEFSGERDDEKWIWRVEPNSIKVVS